MPKTQKTLQRQTFKDLSVYNLRWVFCSGISTSQVTSVNGPELIIVLYTHSYSGVFCAAFYYTCNHNLVDWGSIFCPKKLGTEPPTTVTTEPDNASGPRIEMKDN